MSLYGRYFLRHGPMVSCLAIVFSWTPASAQSVEGISPAAEERASGDIVVTARKREERLVDIPVSLQAFTSEDIADSGVRDLQDLSRYTPSLNFVNGTQGQGGRMISEVRFRGLSTSVPTPTNQTGSVFIDGLYVLGGAQSIGFEDIDRVEVIKGPQSAYFGRATFAGAVNFITKDPVDTFGAESSASYSPTYGSYMLSGAVEGGIMPGIVNARLSASARHKGAQYPTSDGGDQGREDTQSINLTLLFKPTDGLKIKLRGSYMRDDDGSPTSSYFQYDAMGNCPIGTPIEVKTQNGPMTARFARRFQCGDIPYVRSIIDKNTAFVTLPPLGSQAAVDVRGVLVNNSLNDPLLADAPDLDHFGLLRHTYRLAGTFDYDINEQLTLSGAAAWNQQRANAIRDGDGTGRMASYSATPHKFTDYSFEGRLVYDNAKWLRAVAGVNYFNQKVLADTDNGVTIFNSIMTAPGVFTRSITSSANNENDAIETKGIFFGVDVKPLDWVTLTAEGRYQIDDYTTFTGTNAAGNLAANNLRSKNFTPRLILSVNPVQNMTLYANYSIGVLPGGYNSRFLSLSAAQQSAVLAAVPTLPIELASEKLKNYEIGYKQFFPDMGLTLSLALFQMKWTEIKTSTAILVPALANPVFTVVLPGSAKIKGLEFEGTWQANDNLSLRSSVGYIDSKYTDFAAVAINSLIGIPTSNPYKADGNRLPRNPRWTASGNVTWTAPLNDRIDYHVRADVLYTGKQYVDELNVTTLSPYTTANLAVGIDTPAATFELFATNLFNEKAWANGRRFLDYTVVGVNNAAVGQGAYVQPIDKRELGVRMRYKF